MVQGYSESELVNNRSSLLLFGGSESDRRAWAEEAAGYFPSEGPLLEVTSADKLGDQLTGSRGVLYFPNIGLYPFDVQAKVLYALLADERPKLVIGLTSAPDDAVSAGLLRDDIAFRLRKNLVDLSTPGLKDALKARRASRPKVEQAAASTAPATKSSSVTFIARKTGPDGKKLPGTKGKR